MSTPARTTGRSAGRGTETDPGDEIAPHAEIALRPEIGPIRPPKASRLTEESLGGLHVITSRMPGVPMVELRLAFPLAAHLVRRPAASMVLSESLLAGTARHDRAGLASSVQRIGGRLGAGVAGDWILVSGSVLAEHLVEMLQILGEVLSGASYPSSEVSRRSRSSGRASPDGAQPARCHCRRGAQQAAASRTSLRLRAPEPRGVAEHQRGQSAQDSQRDPGSERCGHLVLVGDVTPSRALSAAAGGLEQWLTQAAGGLCRAARPVASRCVLGPVQLFDRPGAVQSNIRIACLAPGRADPWWPSAALANLIFGGMFASRLVENLRERNGYAYSPRTSFDHGRAGSSFVIQADVATSSTAASLLEINYELGRIATKGVTDEELESARRYALGTLAFQTATQDGLAGTLASLAVIGLDPGYLGRYAAAVKRTKRHRSTRLPAACWHRRRWWPSFSATRMLSPASSLSSPRFSPVRFRRLRNENVRAAAFGSTCGMMWRWLTSSRRGSRPRPQRGCRAASRVAD